MMIITRTPLRVSFAGGGSDLPTFYREHGGAVVSVAIDRHVYLSMHPYFHDTRSILKYSQNENVASRDEIRHPIIRQVFTDYDIDGVDFASTADVPAGSGMGSSSAFTVGLVNLCNAYVGRYMSRSDIAKEACRIEIDKLGEPIGKQDQYASALGGLNYISFRPDESVGIEPILLSGSKRNELQHSLVLCYLGKTRSASGVLRDQTANMRMDNSKVVRVQAMVNLADELRRELHAGNVAAVGDVMDRGWHYKRELASSISSPEIDELYQLGMHNGATGGKLLGAGGGGFLLFHVPVERRQEFATKMPGLTVLPLTIDHDGTTLIYYHDNDIPRIGVA